MTRRPGGGESRAHPTHLPAVAPGTALPVTVAGPPHVVAQVTAFVESRLGWQVTDGAELPPAVHLVGVAGDGDPARTAGLGGADVPAVLLVGADDPPLAVAAHARDAAAVLGWPGEHERLAATVAEVVDAAPSPSVAPVTVGGATGGVGATTVAITLAAWGAWSGRRALAVVSGDVPVPAAASVAAEVVLGHRAWAAATAVPDVAGLRVVRTDALAGDPAVTDDVAVVVDRGAGKVEVDVLVARRDRAGLAAVTAAPCAAVVLADVGLVPVGDFRRATVGRRLVLVPWSSRVATAHDRQRVPGSLPGSFTAPLRPLAPAGVP